MTEILLLTYLGGVLTILSPCILPILPFVFARADQKFLTSILPMLAGMALTFAAIASLAAVGGGWIVHANEAGHAAAMALLALFGLTLIFPELSDHLTRPLVAFGNRISANTGGTGRGEIAGSLVLGIAIGFLWAPCAGPILGLVLTGAALQGASARTSLLLLSYAARVPQPRSPWRCSPAGAYSTRSKEQCRPAISSAAASAPPWSPRSPSSPSAWIPDF